MGTYPCFSRQDRFDLAVREVVQRAVQQCDYEPETYLLLAGRYGGFEAARRLLADPVSDDSLQLWARGRSDLAIEALARSEEWKELFSADEQSLAERRCAEWLSAPAASELVAQVLTEAVNPLLLEPENDIAWGE
jgi:hypothetical protein